VDGLFLGRVQVARRNELGAAAPEREEERHGLRLEMDAGADREPRERPRLLELVADGPQEPATLDDPLDPPPPVHEPAQEA
jgi:hypothetical protein